MQQNGDVEVPFLPLSSTLAVHRADERPDLWERARSQFDDVWPEYNRHGIHTGEYFGALVPRYARFQILLTDERTGNVIGRGRTIPLRWDGTLGDLPAGIDAAGQRALHAEATPDTLCALAAEVASGHQGRGLSRLVLLAMGHVARAAGFATLVAPVRPSAKDRYR